jgi:hypothetical protein
MNPEDFKPYIVELILNGKTEDALTELAKQYGVKVPTLKVGLPKKHKRTAYGCYTEGNADSFAADFLAAYRLALLKKSLRHSS